MCEKWTQFFPGKYTQNHWFTDVASVRSSVKQQLEKLPKSPGMGSKSGPRDKTSHASVGGPLLQSEVERYAQEIAGQVKSMKDTRAANTIKLSDARAMLSFEEVRAFQRPSGEMDHLLQRVAAVRTLLLAAVDKHNAVDPEDAKELAQSEAAMVQEQIDASKEKGDTELTIQLTACARSLQKALDKATKAAAG